MSKLLVYSIFLTYVYRPGPQWSNVAQGKKNKTHLAHCLLPPDKTSVSVDLLHVLVHVQTEGRASCYCHEPGRVIRHVHAVTSRGDEFQSRVSLHALIERGRRQKEQSEDFSNFTGAKGQINI